MEFGNYSISERPVVRKAVWYNEAVLQFYACDFSFTLWRRPTTKLLLSVVVDELCLASAPSVGQCSFVFSRINGTKVMRNIDILEFKADNSAPNMDQAKTEQGPTSTSRNLSL